MVQVAAIGDSTNRLLSPASAGLSFFEPKRHPCPRKQNPRLDSLGLDRWVRAGGGTFGAIIN
jgi:hypothetical protein